MIKLMKDNKMFEVRTQVQASAFIKSGWNVVIDKPVAIDNIDKVEKVDVIEQVQLTTQYTKTDINRMSTSDLQKLANDNDVDNANEMSGSKLKKILIDKLCK